MPASAAPKTEISLHLSADELAAVDRHLRESQSRQSREEALAGIIRRWAVDKGLLPEQGDEDGLEPDELNASNDG
ncbi:hypothetical protein [Bosea sp. BK604]|uniref:hypothetical protein n=1 Tax=Bosea sp. BK604 TaxID=2512180 RepID=UPI001043EA5E|nr:hypothetical protein [Bosea sp. BK604]TCR66523.1 hypothetical protein EV560_104403 [Bosea sp. BK604]